MPKLLIFAPCEKVIIDQENNPSLISVLQGLTSTLPKDAKVPQDALAVIRWTIFTLWNREEADEGKEFTQDCVLLSPDGKPTINVSMPFRFTGSTQRNIMQLYGFPIAPGEYLLKLRLSEGDGERREIATYPLIFTHQEQT